MKLVYQFLELLEHCSPESAEQWWTRMKPVNEPVPASWILNCNWDANIMFTTCFCCNQWTDRHYHSQSHDANSTCNLTMCALRLRFCYTCTLTSAPLLTRNSRHMAPCVEAAAKCSGVKPLLFSWLTLAPQSISSLTTASWPLKQAKWSAVFPNALVSSICGQSNSVTTKNIFAYAHVLMFVSWPPQPGSAGVWQQQSVRWRQPYGGVCTPVCPYSWSLPPDSPTDTPHSDDLQGAHQSTPSII